MKHPAELSFEESCKLELKLVEQEAVIKALREQVLYWRNLMKEFCDNMDNSLIAEVKGFPYSALDKDGRLKTINCNL
jgi:uncharacterized coiled-coil protein SlyX